MLVKSQRISTNHRTMDTWESHDSCVEMYRERSWMCGKNVVNATPVFGNPVQPF
jgi:hypothetical protein